MQSIQPTLTNATTIRLGKIPQILPQMLPLRAGFRWLGARHNSCATIICAGRSALLVQPRNMQTTSVYYATRNRPDAARRPYRKNLLPRVIRQTRNTPGVRAKITICHAAVPSSSCLGREASNRQTRYESQYGMLHTIEFQDGGRCKIANNRRARLHASHYSSTNCRTWVLQRTSFSLGLP